MLHLGVITLLPEMLEALNYGIVGRSIRQSLVTVNHWNPREWSKGVHHQIDDKPYGGGPGMVMMYKPLSKAIRHAKTSMPKGCRTIYLSPQGRQINQQDLNEIAQCKQALLFLTGRYEGIDERIIMTHVDEEWSLGDFVLSGGELAAMAFIDAIVRLLPGSLGDQSSALQDSFMNGLLDYPHYTRPESIEGMNVPAVLLSGNHSSIALWRRKQSLGRTWLKRPDLLKCLELSELDKQLLNEFKNEKE
ncbi:MAG: tRNA (guanosine(37)-N1)-methyltransferase TrmD [Legionellales bacterium RIFCSPHIGHO2_12_FULL_42_9]|nr:MAG: tRNA (guanosine(37)-N1)-methyltransferase TrmD [Legionellales bacterium RIFCSPHIGHO2_12_FULL_42_9]